MKRVFEMLARFAGLLASLAIVLMMLQVAIAVVMRVAFDHPLLGTTAIVSYFYMVIATFLGIFTATWRKEQIQVDVIAYALPRRLRRVTDALAELVTFVYFACFTWGLTVIALQQTSQHEQVDAVIADITVWPMRWIAVIGVGLAAVAMAYWTVRRLFSSVHSDTLVEPGSPE